MKHRIVSIGLFCLVIIISGCVGVDNTVETPSAENSMEIGSSENYAEKEMDGLLGNYAIATFAGGCFWCMEPPFDKVDGVIATVSGYTGGKSKNPTYHQVSAGYTGHAEVVRIAYDPEKVSYQQLLEVFWKNIDPTVKDRQFCDQGDQYRSAIFYHDETQKRLAQLSKTKIVGQLQGKKIYTQIAPASKFYKAEGYHQNYYQRNPVRYRYYRYACGRDERLAELWGENN